MELQKGRVFEVFNKEESFLLNTLKTFGIGVQSISLVKEKFYDHYNIRLSPGTRANKIDRCLMDIGLAMEARSMPTGSVIMSDGLYRISIQREQVISPPLTDLVTTLDDKQFIPIALGVSSDGQPISLDLSDVPNLLVAGTTGSGKSVLLHSIIMSALSGGANLYISDPKMVEFDQYRDCDGVRGVANSFEETITMIEGITQIMNNRFEFLRKNGLRSAKDIFERTGSADSMRPICLVIDEWADLVLQDKSIQKPLCKLAQKGRAAGISVVLSTQRPSSSVISGLIKSNFPGRVALRTASATDSRVILDQKGAEKLSEVGMALLLDGKSSAPKLFRAPNIVDIKEEMARVGISKSTRSKKTWWSRLGF